MPTQVGKCYRLAARRVEDPVITGNAVKVTLLSLFELHSGKGLSVPVGHNKSSAAPQKLACAST
jgi:hypothetical protein